jgi:hypothetical protein
MNDIKYQISQSHNIAKKLQGILAFAVIAVGLFAGSTAQGQAAKFHSAEASIESDGALVVDFEQRGLGEGDIDYKLTADAEAVFACINKGGKNPEAANKQSLEDEVTADESFESKNGRVIASIEAGPPLGEGFTCPNGQRRVLASVEYTNILLEDLTNGESIQIDDVSEVFFEV